MAAGKATAAPSRRKDPSKDLRDQLRTCRAELRQALEQQAATAAILKVISSSPADVQPVFDAIVESAVRLCGADHCIAARFDGEMLHPLAYHGFSAEALKIIADTFPARPSLRNLLGRAALKRGVDIVPDMLADPDYSHEFAYAGGWRSGFAVPMLRDGKLIGTIAVSRTALGAFPQHHIDLLQTFADQAVIAIENVRLFREIQEKSRQLEIANRHKSQFLANMSHELRTPLNCINGFSEMLLANMFGELNAKQAEFLRDINTSGEHLLALINDVLDLSKIEAGRMELFLTSFDPGVTLDNTVMLIKERASRRGIAVNLTVDDRLDTWVGDERKIRQVILNLLSNAIKFTPEGGRIDVTATRESSAMVVAVSDTGIGIKREDQERIFAEFQQVGSDYTKKAEGTGLGLALSRKFVELHGGAIMVESAEGEGSTFTFRIPLVDKVTA
jgi:signal transduction histidine kinase